MTEKELMAVEQELKRSLDGCDVDLCIDLLAEVRRLRGLIKEAEHNTHYEIDRCPWCWVLFGVSHYDCPAFTPEGTLK